MTLRYTALASGSAGNASLVQTSVAGALIDGGLAPADLVARLDRAGLSPDAVRALLLTHTHTDHWKNQTLTWMLKRGVPLYCHAGHHAALRKQSAAFAEMLEAGLVRPFVVGEEFCPILGLSCRAFEVRHDSGPTFGFRVEGPADLLGRRAALGYASDLGTWDAAVAEALADVDLLALEFNHDLELERSSKRPAFLVARVLGDEGHLSNDQAAALVAAALGRSPRGRLRHLVQLHLSRDCNKPELAKRAGKRALRQAGSDAAVHVAAQDEPGKTLRLDPTASAKTRAARPSAVPKAEPLYRQAWLPWVS